MLCTMTAGVPGMNLGRCWAIRRAPASTPPPGGYADDGDGFPGEEIFCGGGLKGDEVRKGRGHERQDGSVCRQGSRSHTVGLGLRLVMPGLVPGIHVLKM